jgi:hypothetical protein
MLECSRNTNGSQNASWGADVGEIAVRSVVDVFPRRPKEVRFDGTEGRVAVVVLGESRAERRATVDLVLLSRGDEGRRRGAWIVRRPHHELWWIDRVTHEIAILRGDLTCRLGDRRTLALSQGSPTGPPFGSTLSWIPGDPMKLASNRLAGPVLPSVGDVARILLESQ